MRKNLENGKVLKRIGKILIKRIISLKVIQVNNGSKEN